MKHFVRRISLRNFLSFGPEGGSIDLAPLNVLIGANGAGKSNLIEAFALLQSCTRDLTTVIREGGGTREWLWKGSVSTPTAEIGAIIEYPDGIMPLRHSIWFSTSGPRFELVDEVVENEHPDAPGFSDVRFFYRFNNGHPVLNVRTRYEEQAGTGRGRIERSLRREEMNLDQSVLAQRKDPDQYPEITYLGRMYEKIRLFREWNLGRYTPARLPQKPDLPEDFLLPDASNLGLVLNDLEHRGSSKTVVMQRLKALSGAITDISTKVHGGSVQVFLHEKGLHEPIPATRLSDGMLRYLCLLSVLCHPSPPPLICIEEPELGMHPDILPVIAELLREASQRSQLVVTTHSDILVDALTDTPEAILVCEKQDGATTVRRLEREPLKKWLAEYSLGQLMLRGDLGGMRW